MPGKEALAQGPAHQPGPACRPKPHSVLRAQVPEPQQPTREAAGVLPSPGQIRDREGLQGRGQRARRCHLAPPGLQVPGAWQRGLTQCSGWRPGVAGTTGPPPRRPGPPLWVMELVARQEPVWEGAVPPPGQGVPPLASRPHLTGSAWRWPPGATGQGLSTQGWLSDPGPRPRRPQLWRPRQDLVGAGSPGFGPRRGPHRWSPCPHWASVPLCPTVSGRGDELPPDRRRGPAVDGEASRPLTFPEPQVSCGAWQGSAGASCPLGSLLRALTTGLLASAAPGAGGPSPGPSQCGHLRLLGAEGHRRGV